MEIENDFSQLHSHEGNYSIYRSNASGPVLFDQTDINEIKWISSCV